MRENNEQSRQMVEKVCTECGNQFKEKQESVMYECERCVGRHEH